MFEHIILGFIQGITEFLPISSSGHLVLIPYIFNWDYQGLSFDVALHAGTALALLGFFWRDWVDIIKNAFQNMPLLSANTPSFQGGAEGGFEGGAGEHISNKYSKNLLWQIIVASIPAAIIGLTIDDYIEEKFHSIILIAFNLAFFGLILWYADKKSKTDLKPRQMTYAKAFLVGLFQAIALIPGVSRSGITITASRLIGLPRQEAAKFSFLIATPAIVGAFILKLPDILEQGINLSFCLGVLSATIFGFLAIKFLLAYLKKSDFSVFFWYRLALSLLVLIIFLIRI